MPNPEKLNWFTITKKYWKEQVIFYILATFSAVINYIMDVNVARIIEGIIKGTLKKNIPFKLFNKDLYVFQERNNFFDSWQFT